MERQFNFTRNGLQRAVEDAAHCSRSNSAATADPFGTELEKAMNWYAFTLPSMLQQDGITVKETLPSSRRVEITSVPDKEGDKNRHPLIKEVREGKIFFVHPLKYVVKPGDTLSRISFSVTGGKASVSNLKRWNSLSDDTIYPGQEFFIANPDDELINKVLWTTTSNTWRSKNPSVDIEKLGPELAGKYTGRNKEQYLVKLVLKYDESAEQFLNPSMIPAIEGPQTPFITPPVKKGEGRSAPGSNSFGELIQPVRKGLEEFDPDLKLTNKVSHDFLIFDGPGMAAYGNITASKSHGEGANEISLSHTGAWDHTLSHSLGNLTFSLNTSDYTLGLKYNAGSDSYSSGISPRGLSYGIGKNMEDGTEIVGTVMIEPQYDELLVVAGATVLVIGGVAVMAGDVVTIPSGEGVIGWFMVRRGLSLIW